MPAWGPINRKDLIKPLKQAGFEGPLVGGKHEFMLKNNLRLTLPNPHHGDISKGLRARIIKQAGLSRKDWERL